MVAELLKHPRLYNFRAITRNTTKPKAQKLAAQGVELFCADLESGREALTAAFAGADVIYALTDFWQKQSAAAEIEQGKAIADAAAEITTLQHFIWSALPDPVALSNGQFRNVHHWMGKNIITEYIQTQKPDLWAKTTTVLFPNYFENTLTDPQRYLPVKVSYSVRSNHIKCSCTSRHRTPMAPTTSGSRTARTRFCPMWQSVIPASWCTWSSKLAPPTSPRPSHSGLRRCLRPTSSLSWAPVWSPNRPVVHHANLRNRLQCSDSLSRIQL